MEILMIFFINASPIICNLELRAVIPSGPCKNDIQNKNKYGTKNASNVAS
jgi:hypothetical protein